MSLLKRISLATGAVAIAGIIGLASVARANCSDCGSDMVACIHAVVATFESCITTAHTRASKQACGTVAHNEIKECQTNHSICIGACSGRSKPARD
jgi:hypothetical protein